MNTPTNTSLTPELVGVGMKQLESIRASAMAEVLREVRDTLPAWKTAKDAGTMPADVPEWISTCFTAAVLPAGGTHWETVRDAFALQTAKIIEEEPLCEHMTGGSLARFIGVGLFAFCRQGWEGTIAAASNVTDLMHSTKPQEAPANV